MRRAFLGLALTASVSAQGLAPLDLRPGPLGSLDQVGGSLASLGDVHLFVADDGVSGAELWRSDGTAAGTFQLLDADPGAGSGGAGEPCVHRGRMFFTAYAPNSGQELYVTDGTVAGTSLVRDIVPGPGNSNPFRLVSFLGDVWFQTASSIWRSDGTAAGTHPVPGVQVGPVEWLVHRDRLVMLSSQPTGEVVYAYDGTILRRLGAFPASATPATLLGVTRNGVVFAARATSGFELYATDGVAPLGAAFATANGEPRRVAPVGDRLYFRTPGLGEDLWVTDGTSGGTQLVRAFQRHVQAGIAVGERLWFSADDGYFSAAPRYWLSDGTTAGTLATSLVSGQGLFALGERFVLAFADRPGVGREPAVFDAATGGLLAVVDIKPGAAGSNGFRFQQAGATVWFRADDGVIGTEPWKLAVSGTARPIGHSCGDQYLRLAANDPRLGHLLALRGSSSMPLNPVVLAIGRRAATPLLVGGVCELHVDPSVAAVVSTMSGLDGGFAFQFTVPNDPGLLGVVLAAQGWWVTSGPFLFSNAVELVTGT